MERDRERWNKKYSEGIYLTEPSESVRKYYVLSCGKNALDIAAGMGRNSKFLISKGFKVEALELSDVAIENLKKIKGLNVIQVDLDNHKLDKEKYDLVICINYLNRALFPEIKKTLKRNGILIYESLMKGEETDKLDRNPEYLLKKGELFSSFSDLEIIEYKEFVTSTINKNRINKALLVARKSD